MDINPTLVRIVQSYDESNPFRTADLHSPECDCLRCAVDEARTILEGSVEGVSLLINTADLKKMVSALKAHRGHSWWFDTENENGESTALSPLVLQNMKLGFESGSIEPNMNQVMNILKTAIYYQRKYAERDRNGL